MTKRSEHEWLADIISWGERLQRHVDGIDRTTFLGSEIIQDAVCKCIEALGEAAGKLDDLAPELDRALPGLNLKLARKMRDRISHGYYRIDWDIIWDTAVTSVPETVEAARSLMRKYDSDDGAGRRASGPPV
ncbi:DUF86 domain-containing protein [Bradyrhizobium sp.]|jgi:uncharacterized protein with HEPN domain|uniref:HepT-like ribonuclease domain-containing protein n=1 Tax=Bradyrhizobium sp. TaxID=376 RepID=UPI003C1D57D2